MQIIFESRDADGNLMRELSVERVRFALRRAIQVLTRSLQRSKKPVRGRTVRLAQDHTDE